MPAPWLLALGLALALIVLIPAKRLQLAGLSGRVTGAYAIALWLLGMVIAIRPIGIRFLLPILLIAYLAPFVAGPERLSRIVQRRPGRGGGPGATSEPPKPPIKNVTPPDQPLGPE